jgi:thioredoxin-dependent peroxiredoxin
MKAGDQVPDFDAMLHDGRTLRLSSILEEGPLVLFFYPKAFTPGCTAEARHFRDLDREFEELGARRLGVSRDDVETQARFAQEHELDFPLIADPDGRIARIFGAKRLGPIPSKRRTFVIGADRTLLGAISSETNMERHADEALELLRKEG